MYDMMMIIICFLFHVDDFYDLNTDTNVGKALERVVDTDPVENFGNTNKENSKRWCGQLYLKLDRA